MRECEVPQSEWIVSFFFLIMNVLFIEEFGEFLIYGI